MVVITALLIDRCSHASLPSAEAAAAAARFMRSSQICRWENVACTWRSYLGSWSTDQPPVSSRTVLHALWWRRAGRRQGTSPREPADRHSAVMHRDCSCECLKCDDLATKWRTRDGTMSVTIATRDRLQIAVDEHYGYVALNNCTLYSKETKSLFFAIVLFLLTDFNSFVTMMMTITF